MVKVDTSQGNLVAVSELQSATTGYAQKMTRKRMKEKVYYGLWRSAFAKAVKETSKPQVSYKQSTSGFQSIKIHCEHTVTYFLLLRISETMQVSS